MWNFLKNWFLLLVNIALTLIILGAIAIAITTFLTN